MFEPDAAPLDPSSDPTVPPADGRPGPADLARRDPQPLAAYSLGYYSRLGRAIHARFFVPFPDRGTQTCLTRLLGWLRDVASELRAPATDAFRAANPPGPVPSARCSA